MTLLLPTQKLLSTQRLLPTSTAGSLPKPSWLAEPEKIWSPWALEGEQLLEAKQDALRVSLQEQFIKPYQAILEEWATSFDVNERTSEACADKEYAA